MSDSISGPLGFRDAHGLIGIRASAVKMLRHLWDPHFARPILYHRVVCSPRGISTPTHFYDPRGQGVSVAVKSETQLYGCCRRNSGGWLGRWGLPVR